MELDDKFNHNHEDNDDDFKEDEENLSDEDECDEETYEDDLTVVSSHNNDNDPIEVVGDVRNKTNSASRCKEEARLDTLMEVGNLKIL